MLEWLGEGYDEQKVLAKWVLSEPVRRVERGEISVEEFSRGVVDDLRLPVDPETFIREYDSWHKGPYEGAAELIEELSETYVTASLSNISEFQWAKIRRAEFVRRMKFNFVSFEIGCAKPDTRAFDHVLRTLRAAPPDVCFFDDNRLNVETAAGMGIRAHRTCGVGELRETLASLGILPYAALRPRRGRRSSGRRSAP